MSHFQPRERAFRVAVLRLLVGCAASALAYGPSLAQPAAEENEVDEVVVTGSRQQGAVIGDIPPEIQLNARDIRAYGVSSVAELVDALAPQTASGQGQGGRPVILINGARTSGFNEVRDLPTEAIQRVDILPEEVALKYGYRADQKVINLVLRQRFHATTAEAGYKASTQAGGGDTTDAHANLLHIRRQNRFQLDAKASYAEPLLESERDIVGRPDSAFRTLSSETRDLSLNTVLTRPLMDGVSGTLNGTLDATRSEGQLGLSPFTAGALERVTDSVEGRLGAAANGALAGWQWSYTGAVDRSDIKTTTQRVLAGAAFTDRARTQITSAESELVLTRALFQLPAGAVSTTLQGGAGTLRFDAESVRSGVRRSRDMTRDSGHLQASFDMPVTSRGKDVLAGVGDLSVNVNLALENLSDFGDLASVGYGLNWSPIKPIRVIASYTQEDGAPTVQQVGDPEVATPGVRVFDLRRGETVDVVRIEGGSPGLDPDNRRVVKLGLTLKPFDKTDLTLTANYTSTRTRDVIAAFPSASSLVEDAFPNRFVRDAQGRLVQIDARPVNFERQDRDELRWGFTFRKSLPSRPPPGFTPGQRPGGSRDGQAGAQGQAGAPVPGGSALGALPPGALPPPGEGGRQAAGPGGQGPRGPGGFGGFGGPGGGRGGVFQIGLYHTVAFRDEVLIRPGAPVLDLLDGAAIGNGGGSPRHQVDLQANLSRNGLGASLNAKWQSSTTVRGAGAAATGDLNFSDLTTVNLRLFADLGLQPFAQRHTWLRGARASLAINNLFDERQDVRTTQGVTPIRYQPDYLDPVGRSVRLSVRKLFF